jgi:hypothetical protein
MVALLGPAQMNKPKPDDLEQSKRFLETAEEVGADADDAALERAFKKISSQKGKNNPGSRDQNS